MTRLAFQSPHHSPSRGKVALSNNNGHEQQSSFVVAPARSFSFPVAHSPPPPGPTPLLLSDWHKFNLYDTLITLCRRHAHTTHPVYQQICSSPGKPFVLDRSIAFRHKIHHFNTHSSQGDDTHFLPAHCQQLFFSPRSPEPRVLISSTRTTRAHTQQKEGGSHSGGVTYFGCARRSTRSDRVLKLGRSACFCLSYAHARTAHTPRTHTPHTHTIALGNRVPAHHRRSPRRRRETTQPLPPRPPPPPAATPSYREIHGMVVGVGLHQK